MISALLAACGGWQTEDRLPASILMLYGRCAPGGVLEIEAARDGRILEAEVTIPVSDLPPAILAAAKREAAEKALLKSEFKSVERVEREGKALYHVKCTKGPDSSLHPGKVRLAAKQIRSGGPHLLGEAILELKEGELRVLEGWKEETATGDAAAKESSAKKSPADTAARRRS